jgi:uncharacterized membrane protein
MPGKDPHELLDTTFNVTVILKGLDGLLELVGGTLLLVVAPATIDRLVRRLTQHELSQDPHDLIARHLLRVSGNLHHTQVFGAIYLISHGLIKIVLVGALLKKQRWAYPATLLFLGAFVVYQVYRMFYTPSVGLALLTVFDLFIMWLVWREYQLRRHPAANAVPGRRPGTSSA